MGREDFKIVGSFLICLVLLAACKKDKPTNPVVTQPVKTTGSVYIACEGLYGSGDAALSLYVPATDSVYMDIYKSANNQSLGDVLQSMQRIGGYFFLCVNNSDKVVVIDTGTWHLVSTISISKPRYILPISATKAYVSSLYSNKVYVINPQTFQVTNTITLPNQNTEEMLLYNNTAYITTWDTATNQLYTIDPATDNVSGSISVAGRAPQSVLVDKEQKLWVLAGNSTAGKTAILTRIDPANGQILQSYTLPASADAFRPVFNNTKDTIYYIEANYVGSTDNNGIYRMDIHSAALPPQPFIGATQYQYFWALGIDPATGYIYVGDPKGFTQRGSVYIYTPDGTRIKSFTVGIGPGHFYFNQ